MQQKSYIQKDWLGATLIHKSTLVGLGSLLQDAITLFMKTELLQPNYLSLSSTPQRFHHTNTTTLGVKLWEGELPRYSPQPHHSRRWDLNSGEQTPKATITIPVSMQSLTYCSSPRLGKPLPSNLTPRIGFSHTIISLLRIWAIQVPSMARYGDFLQEPKIPKGNHLCFSGKREPSSPLLSLPVLSLVFCWYSLMSNFQANLEWALQNFL